MDMETTLGELEWMKKDIAENEHYQIGMYKDVIERTEKLIEEMNTMIERLQEQVERAMSWR